MFPFHLRQPIIVNKGSKNETSYDSLMMRYPSLTDIEAVQFVRGEITKYRKLISLLTDVPEAHLSGMAADDFFKMRDKIENFLKHGPQEEILQRAMEESQEDSLIQ